MMKKIDVVFDRKDHGRFPEMKEVKQLVRTVIAPEMGLGHSDTAVKSAAAAAASTSTAGSTTESTEAVPAPVQAPTVVVSAERVDDDDDESTKHDAECKTCL